MGRSYMPRWRVEVKLRWLGGHIQHLNMGWKSKFDGRASKKNLVQFAANFEGSYVRSDGANAHLFTHGDKPKVIEATLIDQYNGDDETYHVYRSEFVNKGQGS